MPLDSATYVGALDVTIPADTNFVFEGDDHIRRIKTTLVNSFPLIVGAVGASQTDLPKGKVNGTTAPTVTDDSVAGYAVKSIWADVTNDRIYICIDASVGAAIWLEMSSAIKAGMHMAFFQASTAVMTGWTFQTKDVDYIIRPGAVNNVGGTFSGTPTNVGWEITGLSGTQPNHTHGVGTIDTINPTTGNVGAAAGASIVALYAHSHAITGATASDGNDAVTISATGAWRPPTMFCTIWSKN